MATSTCIKCGGTSFEIKEHSPKYSLYKVYFVQCQSCGGVVGVMDYFNTNARLEVLAKKLNIDLNSPY